MNIFKIYVLILFFICENSIGICQIPSDQFIDTSANRVKAYFKIPFNRIGTVRPRQVKEIESSNWTIGCEVLDRDFANFNSYKDYLPSLGIKKIRLQGGWARTEKQKGVYDWAWLDLIIDEAIERGLTPWLQTSYGNALYEEGGGTDLGAELPTSEESLKAWDEWVETMVTRYKDKVFEWEIWNEPDRFKAEDIVAINIRTAEIIKRTQPHAKIGGLVMASAKNTKLWDEYLKATSDRGKLDLYEWVVYHGYSSNPDDIYNSVDNLKAILSKYSSNLKLRQGESGAPSTYCPLFALKKYNWTEISQAKWNIRRMLGDLGRDIESTILAIIDPYYKGWGEGEGTLNPKGLIQSDASLRAVRPKTAFYSVQNVVSIFDDQLERITNFSYSLTATKSVSTFGYKNTTTGMSLITLWFDGAVPNNHFDTQNIDIVVENMNFISPVWVDIFSGKIYDIPKSNWSKKGSTYTFTNIPIYDSPVLISDESNIKFL